MVMNNNYTYDPSKINDYCKDRMRFELGDTQVEGGAETCALCDEEYQAIIPDKIYTSRQWKKLKLRFLENICHNFAYEPDTKVGPLTLASGKRAELWHKMYADLKKELSKGASDAAAIDVLAINPEYGEVTPPYFYAGIHSHEEAKGVDI